MLYCGRTDIDEGIDPTKSNTRKECMICHYLVFNHGLKFQDSVCNTYHVLTILYLDISDKNVDYCCIVHNI